MNVKSRFFVFLAAVTMLLVACGATTPAGTVRKFYGSLQEGNAEKALSFVSQSFVDTLGREKLLVGLESTIGEIKTKGGIKSIKITDESIDGEAANVSSVVVFGNGEESADTTKLIKENGSWKLAPSK